jgi:hypothetical protein
MNAHLMCPARLEPAFDERQRFELLAHLDVGDGEMPFLAASAPAIAAVANEVRLNCLRL